MLVGPAGDNIAVGFGLMVNEPELLAVFAPMVTETMPEAVVSGRTTVSTVPVFDTTLETGVPPIVILGAVAPKRLVPFIISCPPGQPDIDPKLVMLGTGIGSTVTLSMKKSISAEPLVAPSTALNANFTVCPL